MKKIVAFLGGDYKCGTSMIAQSVAEAVASKRKDLNVILIHTEKDENSIFSPNVNESLETIRPYLTERLIDMNELAEKSRYKENLYIIGGNSKPGSSSSLSPDMSEYLLSASVAIFDLVICDCGCDVDNGMCLGSLFSADDIYLVTSASEAAIRKQECYLSLYKEVKIPLTKIIINKYSKKDINSVDIICSRLGFDIKNSFIVSESLNGEKAEHEGCSIYSMKDYKFKKEIDKIADDLISRAMYEKL